MLRGRAERASCLLRGACRLAALAGRVGDGGIAIAGRFEIEQRGAVIDAVELRGNGLIDRYRDGFGRWIAFKAAVNSDCFVSHRLGLRFELNAEKVSAARR